MAPFSYLKNLQERQKFYYQYLAVPEAQKDLQKSFQETALPIDLQQLLIKSNRKILFGRQSTANKILLKKLNREGVPL